MKSEFKRSARPHADCETQVTRSMWRGVLIRNRNRPFFFNQLTPLRLIVNVPEDEIVGALAAFSSEYKVSVDEVDSALFHLNTRDAIIVMLNGGEVVAVEGKRGSLPVDDVNFRSVAIAGKFCVDGITRTVEVGAIQLEDIIGISISTVGESVASSSATGKNWFGHLVIRRP